MNYKNGDKYERNQKNDKKNSDGTLKKKNDLPLNGIIKYNSGNECNECSKKIKQKEMV